MSNDLPQLAEKKHSINAHGNQWVRAWAMHYRQAAGCGGLLQRKQRQMQHAYTSFITPTCYFQYVGWQFEIRISICTNDISFTRYRLTSLEWTVFYGVMCRWEVMYWMVTGTVLKDCHIPQPTAGGRPSLHLSHQVCSQFSQLFICPVTFSRYRRLLPWYCVCLSVCKGKI